MGQQKPSRLSARDLGCGAGGSSLGFEVPTPEAADVEVLRELGEGVAA